VDPGGGRGESRVCICRSEWRADGESVDRGEGRRKPWRAGKRTRFADGEDCARRKQTRLVDGDSREWA
jgi:hypothetical protein